ncbi:unnamed protein product [Ectocarpus sp. 6 AP-2014]
MYREDTAWEFFTRQGPSARALAAWATRRKVAEIAEQASCTAVLLQVSH